ncbi:MAG: MBOAT family protein [Clostridia bacterium]|nr:MBOAT family protein [Clostridia bacterium]
MVFSSLVFIFAFLAVLLVLYFAVPKKFRMLVLFVMSLAFYGWGEPVFIAVMAVSILSAYGLGFLIAKYRETNKKKAKLFLALSLAVNLAFLAFFKYTNFFINNLALIPWLSSLKPISWLKLPVGISFYTFQIMSYSIDVYRGDAALQRRIIPFGTYVTLFPQLIAGPIVRYKDIDKQLTEREENVDKFASGARRFVAGLAKKILLADAMAEIVKNAGISLTFGATVVSAWMLVVAYTFQIYFDFSGYSDMAIGLGRMFGFEFLENFNYPYISKSITEFWRRWHISLSTWFKEYVYIPLGGNRKGKLIQFRNIAIVWLLTGFWHGASWNFLIWGVYFGALLIIEKVFLLKRLEKLPAFVSRLYALFFIVIGWLIFYHTDLSSGVRCLGSMFGIGVSAFATRTDLYDLFRYLPIFAICAVAATPVPKKLFEKLLARHSALRWSLPVLMFAALFVAVAYIVSSTFSPFLYYIF